MKPHPLLILTLSVFLVSCSTANLRPEYPEAEGNGFDALADSTKNYVVIFNSSGGVSHGVDQTGHMHAWMDGKALGYFKMKHYRILEIEPGEYTIKLQHRDLFLFKSEHPVTIKNSTKAIKIEATMVSNSLELNDVVPYETLSNYQKMTNPPE